MLSPEQIRTIVADHDHYWNDLRDQCRKCHAVYMTRFWDSTDISIKEGIPHIEVARAFATVESYIGALYAKNPSCVVEPDLRGSGSPKIAQFIANKFLLRTREAIEDATRLAFIFPFAGVKISPVEDADAFRRPVATAIPPWEMVLDRTAPEWVRQRWVGHAYQMPLEEAIARFGKKDFESTMYQNWLESRELPDGTTYAAWTEAGGISKWIRVVEMYDLASDKMVIWSPNYAGGTKHLFRGVKVQLGTGVDEDLTTETMTSQIPFRTSSDRPIVPILPFYLARDPARPLEGYSLVWRIYHQLSELNIFRSYQASGVRRMGRMYFVQAGALSDDATTLLNEGADGSFIPVSMGEGMTDLASSIIPVPNPPIPADVINWQMTVEQDLQASGVNAPFVSGEVTGVTATENRLLQEYTSSQLGRMVRVRDQLIADIAKTYNVMMAVIMDDEGEPLVLPEVGPVVVTSSDLDADYTYWAADAGSTPMADQAKRAEFTQIIPLLMQTGFPVEAIRSEIVRMYGLPETFNISPPPPPTGVENGNPNEVGPSGGPDAGNAIGGPGPAPSGGVLPG